ncbi:hypothetical protein KUTeg_017206 [Tegillarca granosa]|uniref:Uncharacterized protein n=1 Tax=Tegillarca granosa TaxID=220873 RepID=A0ABQ9EJ67_TEGGR|nr:hypothetical protein KUTeg_017206 [Tegillarca granosa]
MPSSKIGHVYNGRQDIKLMLVLPVQKAYGTDHSSHLSQLPKFYKDIFRYWNELTNIGDFKISKNISRESLWYNNHITIEDKYNLVPNFLQYYSLCSAIPAQWKYKLRNENNVLLNRDEISLSIRGKDVPIIKASCKDKIR